MASSSIAQTKPRPRAIPLPTANARSRRSLPCAISIFLNASRRRNDGRSSFENLRKFSIKLLPYLKELFGNYKASSSIIYHIYFVFNFSLFFAIRSFLPANRFEAYENLNLQYGHLDVISFHKSKNPLKNTHKIIFQQRVEY